MKKHYLVITADRNWGRGRTLVDAALNASVGTNPVKANIFSAPLDLVDRMDCGVFGEAQFMTANPHTDALTVQTINQMLWVGSYWMKATRKTRKLTLAEIEDSEGSES